MYTVCVVCFNFMIKDVHSQDRKLWLMIVNFNVY